MLKIAYRIQFRYISILYAFKVIVLSASSGDTSDKTHHKIGKKKEVKVTLVQALRLCTDRTAQSGSRGIALLFHDHGTRRG